MSAEKKMKKTPEATLTEIETETCGRCGGTGKYSWNQMDGDRCYGCGGTGIRYTKRGAAAARFLTEIRSLPASELKAGQEVWVHGIMGHKSGWAKIEAIRPYQDLGGSVDGKPRTPRTDLLEIETATCTWCGEEPSKLHRVRQTAEQAEITRIRALAFQDTLTKMGKPRK